MSKFKSEKVMPRYFAIAVVLTLIGFAIVGKAIPGGLTTETRQCECEAYSWKYPEL